LQRFGGTSNMVGAFAREGDGGADGEANGIEVPDRKLENEFGFDGGKAADVFFKDKARAAEERFGTDEAEGFVVRAEDGEVGGAIGGDDVTHVTQVVNKGPSRAGRR